ncbi:hypothetical protein BpHYR1_014300 [Brachionus plicatilis]|uniref:Uncharacterized protein n=1 Tax=Brachionus plicatilis TaxID=10195 RepID=A0A3M7R6J9_BRAPC|nr:hypothetical protein BpHYR1_014300 [Brachionus plicatilis]
MTKLIDDARDVFIRKEIYKKLVRRFWRSVDAYYKGSTYCEVLKEYFSAIILVYHKHNLAESRNNQNLFAVRFIFCKNYIN